MPEPHAPRAVYAEEYLAARVAHEREQRGWSLEKLARAMSEAGCPINQSSIYKIENGDPPRKITVNELITLARVFDVPMEELLLPPEVTASRELAALIVQWHRKNEAAHAVASERDAAWHELAHFVRTHPELGDKVSDAVAVWAEHAAPEERWPFEHAYLMLKLTGDRDTWLEPARRELDKLADVEHAS